MRPLQHVGLALGFGLGALAACFSAPPLVGPYLCDLGTCADPDLTCVNGLCCNLAGEPACPSEGGGDGGPDGGPVGGTDGGSDAGACTVPNPSDCPVPGAKGPCAAGVYSCDGGTRHCEQTVFPLQETCNHRDDDCDEAVDNLPGCPPGTFLGADPADAGFTTGALRTATAVATTTTCSRDLTGNLTEIFDGGRWVGSESGSNHILYAEVNDGGSWNLSMPGAALRLRFGGTLTNVEPANPFAWFQPQVVLCGPNQTVQRLDPDSQFVRVTQDGGWSLDVNVVVPFDGSGNYHSGNTPGPFFRLSEIGRVEVLIAPAAHTPPPAFDINVTQFDVIWP